MMRLVVIVLLVATSVARADEPWEAGVTTDNQTRANSLFAEANQLFAQQAHQAALVKYRQAIELWDHPLIRFNMAVTMIRLDRIVDAAAELTAALRFGEEPFTPELYRQALDYQKLVGGRVGTIHGSCDLTATQLLLDGKVWFSCPGERELRVIAGEHVIVGERKGYMTESRRVIVAGGATVNAKLVLLPIDAVVKLEYRSPRWLPWTVFGAGAAIAIGGVGFAAAAQSQMDEFDREFARICPRGCAADLSDSPQPRLADERASARLNGKVAAVMVVGGGAITVGGIVWAILNRPTRVLPKMEVAPTAGGLAAQVRWHF